MFLSYTSKNFSRPLSNRNELFHSSFGFCVSACYTIHLFRCSVYLAPVQSCMRLSGPNSSSHIFLLSSEYCRLRYRAPSVEVLIRDRRVSISLYDAPFPCHQLVARPKRALLDFLVGSSRLSCCIYIRFIIFKNQSFVVGYTGLWCCVSFSFLRWSRPCRGKHPLYSRGYLFFISIVGCYLYLLCLLSSISYLVSHILYTRFCVLCLWFCVCSVGGVW